MIPITQIETPLHFAISPITANSDGSISATVTIGVLKDGTLSSLAQQSHYLSKEEAAGVYAVPATEGENTLQTFTRAVTIKLRQKGALQF
ncbi:hypothetical protein [Crenobacter cavernae]|uniref:Uncharacterized protein n=1 Tax=Crenobacter cavernae TaxID=2290923 RepID=A0ABY0FD48_9NEIS|nr:hypothetical protein [Crenobacter cavernae]RXZ42719.1 hypothetical protein EBB06_12570 [Crenobacter cavernae]